MSMLVGNKVKNYRAKAQISQMELELKTNTATGSISRIENNLTNPTKETIHAIANALNLSEEERADLFDIKLFSQDSIDLIVTKVIERMHQSSAI